MRFLLPLPTQPERHTGREGGNIAPIDRPGDWRATRRAWWIRLSRVGKKKKESEESESRRVWATSSEIEVWQTMDALIYGLFCQAGERTISSRTIWFNSKGPLETVRVKHWQKRKKKWGGGSKKKKRKRSGETLLYSKHMSGIGTENEHCAFVLHQIFCHTDLQISHHP